jgi:hypothetical protein
MSIASLYPFRVPPTPPSEVRQRFSLTSDILSFRRCEKQYGAFGHDGFVAARATQAFFGSVVHQVLDLCHRQFAQTHALPSDEDIDAYFTEVENALRSHGIRPAAGNVSDKARLILKRFNALEGPVLYPRIRDTEFRMETERPRYVLRGVVDVLATDPNDPANPAKMEIWDYKGSRVPSASSPRMKEYRWQMAVYAELFRRKHGVYPKQAVLYFLNELDSEPPPTQRPLRATVVVPFDPSQVDQALAEFDATADAIMTCQQNSQWPNPAKPPDKETCNICDLRWNCTVPKDPYKQRLPIV